MWIKRKSEERLRIEMPKEIDGVIMEDVVLGEEFEPKIRQYGGVALDEDEKAALKLQPNFAIFEEIDEVEFMACTEKMFNSLRWSENNRNNEMTGTRS